MDLEKYGDLMTNGLDLISFVLVTPEIVRVIAPAARWLIGVTFLSVLLSIACIAGLLPELLRVFFFGQGEAPWSLEDVLVLITLVTFPTAVCVCFILLINHGVFQLADRISKHFLALGILLFLISRLIALYVSVLKIHSS
jgi:hypothetical protein